uniref:Uncharacterized protein n=1 Tax=Cacopsylla melanoneura TaxID=428564 RepID=A0A8D9AJ18_9HEMI
MLCSSSVLLIFWEGSTSVVTRGAHNLEVGGSRSRQKLLKHIIILRTPDTTQENDKVPSRLCLLSVVTLIFHHNTISIIKKKCLIVLCIVYGVWCMVCVVYCVCVIVYGL